MTFTSPSQIQDAVKASLEDRGARQIIITLAGKPVKIREYGEKMVKFIMWSKDLISSAMSTEPHTALAWAGISLLLPLALKPSEESATMLQGLDSISNLLQLYKMREALYLHTNHQAEFEETVVQLYSYIFEYQARMLCHLSRKSVTRAFQNIIKVGQWDDLLKMIRDYDSRCLSYSNLIDLRLEREQWDQQSLQMDRSHHTQEHIVDELKTLRLQRAVERDDDLHREFFHAFSSNYSEYKDFNPPRVPDTCQWFLQNSEFRNWRDSERSCVLWMSAGPGCGKSVLSRCLIDERLISHRAMTSTICYFFFKDGQEGRRSGADALTAILHQLYSSNLQTSLVSHALDKFNLHGKSLTGMFGELWRILTDTAKDPQAGEIVCVVDALDECEQHTRQHFLNELVNFYSRREVRSDAGIRLKFLLTSRPYDHIQSSLDQLSDSISFVHSDADDDYDAISQDINRVIDHQIPRILGGKFDKGGQKQITDYLKSAKNRTYLWLSLVFDVMLAKVATHRTVKKMGNLISELPSSISAAYEQILSKSPDAKLAKAILQIILAARRPLTVSEMNVALEMASGEASTSYADLDLQPDDAFQSSLREICGFLVTIYDSHVYLVHQTAREFLLATPEVGNADNTSSHSVIGWEHTINAVDAETLMAKLCISFLLLKEFLVLPAWGTDITAPWYEWKTKCRLPMKQFVLLEYASCYWAVHYAAIQKSTDRVLLDQALTLCDIEQIAFRTWYPIFRTSRLLEVDFNQYKITIACELGLHILVQQILKGPPSIATSNSYLEPGILKASARGHEKVVKMLLDKGADANTQDEVYGNVLQLASAVGQQEVVKILLDKGADMNTRGFIYGNALQAASSEGHLEVVKILLEQGADMNAQGGLYGNALQAASVKGHQEVVKILLDKGVNVNAQGGEYGNALQAASAKGHLEVVKMLLDNGADTMA